MSSADFFEGLITGGSAVVIDISFAGSSVAFDAAAALANREALPPPNMDRTLPASLLGDVPALAAVSTVIVGFEVAAAVGPPSFFCNRDPSAANPLRASSAIISATSPAHTRTHIDKR
jgi:hypothetical protein